MGKQKVELKDEIKGDIHETSDENELSDEALEQVVGGILIDLKPRFNKAEIPLSTGLLYAASKAPAMTSD